jgi:hypothetical protein
LVGKIPPEYSSLPELRLQQEYSGGIFPTNGIGAISMCECECGCAVSCRGRLRGAWSLESTGGGCENGHTPGQLDVESRKCPMVGMQTFRKLE